MKVNLTKKQLAGLDALARCSGKSRSRIVREAVDRMLADHAKKIAAIRAAAGMWKDRTDLPDFAALRRGWNRR